ncbi:uncharacterized protein LY89DRAFT_728090 [Mollisia scopiformis]|uniref:2EXR domain-containing protein n=1 Tax=Mollisia scopiformis TaxID=149040 RepID=A0A194XT60_MOLSC|nr:uncharacterized protein LY89DRAFT_728090 [Mollisia scopiformis]KUJ23336.1 hypothetical protein LY89DRAFT_728090 [Mollisia scopiformis]
MSFEAKPQEPKPFDTALSMANSLDIATAPPLTSFRRFRDLPKELRDEIWKLSLPRLRYVNISAPMVGIGRINNSSTLTQRKCVIKTQIPGHLGACQESRSIALKYYPPQLHNRHGGYPINLDYDTDILYFESKDDFCAFYSALALFGASGGAEIRHSLRNVRKLMIRGKFLSEHHRSLLILAKMDQLEHLALEGESWLVEAASAARFCYRYAPVTLHYRCKNAGRRAGEFLIPNFLSCNKMDEAVALGRSFVGYPRDRESNQDSERFTSFQRLSLPELNSPRNGMLVSTIFEKVWDEGFLAIVPAISDEPLPEEIEAWEELEPK